MKRVFAGVLALALALAVAGCGAAAESQDEQGERERAITAAQVVAEFRQATGAPRLRPTEEPDAAWEQLGLGLDIPEELRERYGVFNVYVVKPGRPEAVRSLLSDKETRKELEPGASGIYWDYDTLARSYVAYKRYASNVVLAWWNERDAQGTDARFDRLDALLAGLETG